jgi:heme exporter protein D
MTLQEFFYMGGHGYYVWPSYGIAMIVLLFNVIRPLQQLRQLKRELVLQQQFQQDKA